MVDRITDLPVNYSKYLTNRRAPSVQSNANYYEQQPAPQPQFSQAEPAQQYRSTTYNYPGLFTTSQEIRTHTSHESILGAYSTTYRSSYTNQGGNRSGYGSSGTAGGQSGANYSKYV